MKDPGYGEESPFEKSDYRPAPYIREMF